MRSMVEKMVHDGVPDDTSARSLFDKATSAKNMMSRIRGYSPSQWVLANATASFLSLSRSMMRTKIMFLTKISQKAKTMNSLARFVSEMQLAVLSWLQTRTTGFARPPWCLKLVKVTIVDFFGGCIFMQSAERLSHVTERERLARDAVSESQGLVKDTDQVIGEPGFPQQLSFQNTGQLWTHLCQNSSPMFRCLIQISRKHLATQWTTMIVTNRHQHAKT